MRGRDIGRPPPPEAGFAAFAACLLLAFAAGRVAGPERREGERSPRPRWAPARIAGAAVCGAIALLLALRTASLQSRPEVPLGAIAAWAGSLLSAAIAFLLLSSAPAPGTRPRVAIAAVAAAAALLALGGWSRLAGLAEVPAGFGGDEAAQVQDAAGLLSGRDAGDPFGTGWYGTMRLGMLPAGVGAFFSEDPVAGPRRPYAIAGTLSLLGAMAAAGQIAGAWGALGCGALLVAAPHHVHFSRIASVMILDSLVAAFFLFALIRAHDTASPFWSFAAAGLAGLALYGYAGGRVVPTAFLLTAPFLLASKKARGRRLLLAFALASGVLLAAAPNLRFAARNFVEWNSRWNQTGIFRDEWWGPKLKELGSPSRILMEQFREGTVGLLYRVSGWPWFRGYPLVGPFPLPALAAAGAGWLLGRGRWLAAIVPSLVVGGNFAATILTYSTPAPQRLSSLIPALAILGGAAVAAIPSLLPEPRSGKFPLRLAAGAAAVAGVLLLGVRGVPPWWDPSPGYGGSQAGFVPAAARALDAPRFRREPVYLEGLPYVDSNFPSYRYLFAKSRILDRNPSKSAGAPLAPGLHLFATEWIPLVEEWKASGRAARAIPLADPAEPARAIGYIVLVRPEGAAPRSSK